MPDNPQDKLKQEQRELAELLTQESKRIPLLPKEEQPDAVRSLHHLRQQGLSNIRLKAQQIAAGKEIPPPKEAGEGFLQKIFRNLNRPTTIKNATLLANTPSLTPEQQKEYSDLAKSSALGGKTRDVFGSEVLEKMGVGEGGSLSDIAPFLFSESGEGMPLKKGGILDVTARGAAGFAGDVVTDPLNALFIPIKGASIAGRFAGQLGKGANKAFKAATGKTIRDAAYANTVINPMARLFNRHVLQSHDAAKSAIMAEWTKEAQLGLRSLRESGERVLLKDGVAQKYSRILKENPEIVKHGWAVDDITHATKTDDIAELAKIDEGVANLVPEIMKQEGKLSPDSLASTYITNTGLKKEEREALHFFQDIYKKQGPRKVAQKMMTQAELAKRPFFLPRPGTNLDTIDNVALDALRTSDPKRYEALSKFILKKKEAQALGMGGVDISSLLRINLKAGSKEFRRLHPNYVSGQNQMRMLGGELEDDLLKLAFQSETKIRRAEIVNGVLNKARELHDGVLPNAVRDTMQQILLNNSPEAWNAATRTWNKWFLNPLKTCLTLPFPAFLVRNILDDTIRGWQQSGVRFLSPKAFKDAAHINAGSSKLVKFRNDVHFVASEVEEKMFNMHVKRSQAARQDLATVTSTTERQAANVSKTMLGKTKNALNRVQEKHTGLISWMENHSRVKSATVEMQKWLKRHPEIKNVSSIHDPRLADGWLQAAKKSRKAFFDYTELGPIDDMLAQLIPFYRFSRQNLPFQAEMLVKNPQRLGFISKTIGAFNHSPMTQEQFGLLAPYMRENITLSLGDNDTGEHLILSGTGLSLEEFNKLWSSEGLARTLEKATIGQAAPPLQALYTYITNRNPFFGTELTDFRATNTYKAFHAVKPLAELMGGIEKVPVKLQDGKVKHRYELQDPKQYAMVMTVLSPLAAALVTKLVPGGMMLGGALSPRGLTTMGQFSDERIAKDLQTLRFFTGLKISERDFSRDKVRKMLSEVKEQSKALRLEMYKRRRVDRLAQQAAAMGIDDPDLFPGIGDEDDFNETE